MERVFRKAAQRLEAVDGYNADTIFERLQTLSALTMTILGRAITANNHGASVGAIKQAQRNLEFEAELIGQLKGAQNEVVLTVVYESPNPKLRAEMPPEIVPRHNETQGFPAAIDAGPEHIGGFTIQRDEPPTVESHIVPQPPRPPLQRQRQPGRQPRGLLIATSEQPFHIDVNTKL
jgi:hypothetical protein